VEAEETATKGHAGEEGQDLAKGTGKAKDRAELVEESYDMSFLAYHNDLCW